jgi:hypothetical protein
LSGYAAECRHLHGPNWYPDATDLTTAPSPTKDVRMAQEALAALYWPDMEVLHAWTEARAIVSDNWPRLLRVAEMLQERLVLTGEDFEAAWHRCV